MERRKIIVMPEELSSKIAAGEVIERPSSIVKELVENSIDAGATELVVDIEKGGKRSIRVADNGEGIDRQDVALVFERHATSKMYEFDDIYRTGLFGFRGEAINSIAAVSHVEILTRTDGSLSGVRAVAEGAEVREITDVGCPVGTTVTVTRIFAATPARLKFLKRDATEQAHCLDVIARLALSHSGIRMLVRADGREVLSIPQTDDTAQRAAFIFGKDFRKRFLSVQGSRGSMHLKAYLSHPQFSRSNTREMFFFVNSRPVRDTFLHTAVMAGYRHVMEARRYPAVVLHVDMPPEDVDINVHPAKSEVRFQSPRELYGFVSDMVASALATGPVNEHAQTPVSPPGVEKDAGYPHAGDVLKALRRYTISTGSDKKTFKGVFQRHGVPHGPVMTPGLYDSPGQEPGSREGFFSSLQYLGQIAGTYLVFASGDELVLLDQHAAHERVLFERLKNSRDDTTLESQHLLIPEIITLNPAVFSRFSESMPLLQEAGFIVEPYGENTIAVKAVPTLLSQVSPALLITDVIDEFSTTGTAGNIDGRREKLYILLACRGAVKANTVLSDAEISALCRELDSISFAATCPHGRPLLVRITRTELERMFKRA
ncbi:MAG: DNA mismatch repair endonuclease MutL [Deltaproteobacteria bacterium]|nr:DNA mismatch repair endonuclease MutL [Deltaproteobacteria bacterium]